MDELDEDDEEVQDFIENADDHLLIVVNDGKMLVVGSIEDPYEVLSVIMSAYDVVCETNGIEEDDTSDTRTLH